MVLLYYIPIFFCLVSCVSADNWDDFANNLATDLAPLITLFGEQITRQCLSELIDTLDDFIFALVPLGVLTAVVSVIRVCGNSSLRAIIGRAQEDPASSEKEILSCVSHSTAEIFTESGVARITDSPRILEFVADESQAQAGIVNVRKLSEVAGKNWTDLEKDAKLPNLSLNKGIRRRAPFWFHLAATFGVFLQLGIIIYAALTVMYWPQAFLKDGGPVDSYAFPMFVLGTVLLTLGMFLCAVLVERRSIKRIFDLPDGNRAYWIQPGNQTAGDQRFPSFVGRTDKGVNFIRSVRHDSPNNLLNVGREMELILVVGLTMTGFVVQFVGIRGLHSSVSLAQLGATMVMTLVRTGLRAKRMQEGDNMLKDDQDIVSSGEHELDWLLFHLFNIKSFRILPSYCFQGRSAQIQPNPLIQEPMMTRVKLRKLAGSDWDETPVRKMAQNLGQATQNLRKLVQSWYDKETPYFDIAIPIEIQKVGNQQATSGSWDIRLLAEKDVDIDFWDSLIGLYVWSIKRQNSDLIMKKRRDFVKTFNLKGRDAHQARLLYRKWTNDDSVLEHNHPHSVACLKGCETFRYLRSSGSPQTDQTALIRVISDYYTLAVQDIYAHILHSMLQQLPILGGMTQIIGHDKETYRFSNDRIEELVNVFISAGLGDRREGIICILSVLSDQGLLPESTYDSIEVRRHMHELEMLNNKEMFTASEWFCGVADHGEVERVLVDYGYICLRNVMGQRYPGKSLALERIVAILNAGGNGQTSNSISDYLTGIASIPSQNWCAKYRSQMYWISSRILQFEAVGSRSQHAEGNLQELGKHESTYGSMEEIFTDQEAAVSAQSALLNLWFELDFGRLLSDDHVQGILDWLVKNQHYALLEWLVMRMLADLSPSHDDDNLKQMITYTAQKGYKEAADILLHRIEKTDMQGYIIESVASEGDAQTLKVLLSGDVYVKSPRLPERALLRAAENKRHAVIKHLLSSGVHVDTQSNTGETALMIAAKECDIDSATLLLSQGASLEKRDDSGDTALIIAAASGHFSVAELLIKNGANIDATGYRGRTALMAATLGQNLPLVKYLCEQKADIHILSVDQMSVLDVAARGDMTGPWAEGCAFFESIGAQRYVGRKYEEF